MSNFPNRKRLSEEDFEEIVNNSKNSEFIDIVVKANIVTYHLKM